LRKTPTAVDGRDKTGKKYRLATFYRREIEIPSWTQMNIEYRIQESEYRIENESSIE